MSIVKLNNRSVKDITAFGSISSLGSLTHIATQTASSSASISFTSGIDNTYKEYIFYFINLHSSASNAYLYFNGTDDDSSHSFDVTQTTTFFRAYNFENDGARTLEYEASSDVAQGTNARLASGLETDNDSSLSGYLHLFNPSSTTFTKHFMSNTNYEQSAVSINSRCAGYFNTTADITGVQFKLSTGNIDSGQILLFGLN
jgi:hypothetical protein